MSISPDLTILRNLLSSIRSNSAHPMAKCADELASLEKRLRNGDSTASTDFWSLVKMKSWSDAVIDDTAGSAIKFVEDQIASLTEIKSKRSLTKEEIQKAKESLGGVVSSLKNLASIDENSNSVDGSTHDKQSPP